MSSLPHSYINSFDFKGVAGESRVDCPKPGGADINLFGCPGTSPAITQANTTAGIQLEKDIDKLLQMKIAFNLGRMDQIS